MKENPPNVKAREGVVFREEEEGAFLFDPENGRLCYLNSVGIDIWKMCQHRVTPDDIVKSLLESYSGVHQEQIASDCASFLNELDRLGFIEYPTQCTSDHEKP